MTKKLNFTIAMVVILSFFLSICLLGSGLIFDGKNSEIAATASFDLVAEAETTASTVVYKGQEYTEIIGLQGMYKFIVDNDGEAILTWWNNDIYNYNLIVDSYVYEMNVSSVKYRLKSLVSGIFDDIENVVNISLPEAILIANGNCLFSTQRSNINVYIWGNTDLRCDDGSGTSAAVNANFYKNKNIIENNGVFYLLDQITNTAQVIRLWDNSYSSNILDEVYYHDYVSGVSIKYDVVSQNIVTYVNYQGTNYQEINGKDGLYKFIVNEDNQAIITWFNVTSLHIIIPALVYSDTNVEYSVHAIKAGIFDSFNNILTVSLPEDIKIENEKSLFGNYRENITVYCFGSDVLKWDGTDKDAKINAPIYYYSYVYEEDGICYLINSSDKTASVYDIDNSYFGYISEESRTIDIPESIGGYTDYNGNTEFFDVTKIADKAFYLDTNDITVNLPDTITEIGSYAFANSKVKIGVGSFNIKIIGDYAFENYEFVKFDNYTSLTSIGEGAFKNAKTETGNLNEKYFPALEVIGEYAFSGFQSFSDNISFMNLKYIGKYAFELTKIKRAELNVKEIPEGLFSNCFYLEYFYNYLSDFTEVVIGNSAFKNCISLIGVFFENAESQNLAGSFFNDANLDFYHISEMLKYGTLNGRTFNKDAVYPFIYSIGASAFENCLSLLHLGTENTYCFGLTDLRSVEILGESAFSNCVSLNRILFGNSLKTISDYAFFYCTYVTGIMFTKGNTEESKETDINGLCYNSSLTEIGYGAFMYCGAGSEKDTISSYELGFQNLNIIGSYAFYNCRLLSDLSLYDTRTVRERAFAYSSLEKINFFSVVNSIGNLVFEGSSLNSISLKNSKDLTIGDNPFFNCSDLKAENVVLKGQEGIIELKKDMLIKNGNTIVSLFDLNYNRDQLQSVNDQNYKHINFDENINNVGNYVFVNLETVGNIIIPDNIQKIEEYAFFGNEDFGTLIFTSRNSPVLNSMPIVESYEIINSYTGLQIETTTNTYINLDALRLAHIGILFNLINEQTNKYYSNWLYYINENDEAVIMMLLYSTDYYDIKIPDYLGGKKVAYIADCAFSGCDQLQFVGLPNYLKTGGVTSRTFDNCPNLRWVYDRADSYMKSENIAFYSFDSDAKNNTSHYTAIGGVIYEKGAYSNENGNIETGLKLIYVPRSLSGRLWFEDSYAGIKIRYPSAYKTELRISNKVIDDKVESKEGEDGQKVYNVTAHGVEPGAMHNLKYVEVVYLPNGFPYFGEDGEEDLKEYYFKGCRDDLKVFNDSNYDLRIETGWIQFAIDTLLGFFIYEKDNPEYTKIEDEINKEENLINAMENYGYGKGIATKTTTVQEIYKNIRKDNSNLTVDDCFNLAKLYVSSGVEHYNRHKNNIVQLEKKLSETPQTVLLDGLIGAIFKSLSGGNWIDNFKVLFTQLFTIVNPLSFVINVLSFYGMPLLVSKCETLLLELIKNFVSPGIREVMEFFNRRHFTLLYRMLTPGGIIATLLDMVDGIFDGYLDVSLKDGLFYKFKLRAENLNKRKKGEISETAKFLLWFMGDSYYDTRFQNYLIRL